jgi:AmpE protein
LLTLIIALLLHHVVYGFFGLLLSIVIFFYCLGPQNIFYPITQSETQNDQELVGDYFILANRQLFSVIFWFIITGPIGALAYRLITLCREFSPVHEQANETTDLLEWIPARLTVILFLLVGNFQRGVPVLSRFIFAKPETNSEMLRDCGAEAVRNNDKDEISMQAAESLVEHAIIVVLVFIALCTLFSWL